MVDDNKNCSCGCNESCCDGCNEGEEIITLFNEETKKEEDFRIVEVIDYEDKSYVFLNPVQPDDEIGEDEVIICEIGEDEEGNGFILPVDSEETMNKVYEKYVEQYNEAVAEE